MVGTYGRRRRRLQNGRHTGELYSIEELREGGARMVNRPHALCLSFIDMMSRSLTLQCKHVAVDRRSNSASTVAIALARAHDIAVITHGACGIAPGHFNPWQHVQLLLHHPSGTYTQGTPLHTAGTNHKLNKT